MIKLTINSSPLQVEDGTTLLDASRLAGFKVPAMCDNGQLEHFTSCMLCLVKDGSTGKLLPACSAKVTEGMNIITEDEEINEARKTALELLLSEHVGECEAPCRVACPAFMNIPLMNRLIAAGQSRQALQVVASDIALPGVLGAICPAPCENACRRKPIDKAVAICLLKRFTAGELSDLVITPKPSTGKKVAVIGAGPAGISAAYYLQVNGVEVAIFDKNAKPGGAIRYSISDEVLDKRVLEKDVEAIKRVGVVFYQDYNVGKKEFNELREKYDAVVIATGNFTGELNEWELDNDGKQLTINKTGYFTNLRGVFAAGNVTRQSHLAVRSAAQGKEAAFAIARFFAGNSPGDADSYFNSVFGALRPSEYPEYLKEASGDSRQEADCSEGFSTEIARKEASRCMHCDCRKATNCLLRDFSLEFGASKGRFKFSERKQLTKSFQHDSLVHEQGKCIKCGICVRLTAKHEKKLGLTFIGRGFSTEIKVPFDEVMNKAVGDTAQLLCDSCPTGALATLVKY